MWRFLVRIPALPLYELTGRNTVVYYSGWLQKKEAVDSKMSNIFQIDDEDKTGFMSCFNKLDKSKGLDLILHTPGGNIAATESIVYYLRKIFKEDIRVIIPQISMSAGTMISCSAKEIIMGEHSNLGPIDPQLNGLPAHGIIEEFNNAKQEIINAKTQQEIVAVQTLWQPIIAKYPPTFVGECEKAISWSNEMVKKWLETGMFNEEEDSSEIISKILEELGDHSLTKSHSRHISYSKAKEIGLKIKKLEDEKDLQDLILSVHHICSRTLSDTPAIKIIENHNGVAFIKAIQNRKII